MVRFREIGSSESYIDTFARIAEYLFFLLSYLYRGDLWEVGKMQIGILPLSTNG